MEKNPRMEEMTPFDVGKEVLVKVVAQSVPTYSINVFKLPSGLCQELPRMMSKFWWGSNTNGRKIRWYSWGKCANRNQRGALVSKIWKSLI